MYFFKLFLKYPLSSAIVFFFKDSLLVLCINQKKKKKQVFFKKVKSLFPVFVTKSNQSQGEKWNSEREPDTIAPQS